MPDLSLTLLDNLEGEQVEIRWNEDGSLEFIFEEQVIFVLNFCSFLTLNIDNPNIERKQTVDESVMEFIDTTSENN